MMMRGLGFRPRVSADRPALYERAKALGRLLGTDSWLLLDRMSESTPPAAPEGEPGAMRRPERVQAVFKALWVSFAQVVAAVVVTIGCIVAASVAAGADSSDDPWAGVEFIFAGLFLVPLGAVIAGPLLARKLRLANWGTYSLSVVAAVVFMSLDLGNSASFFEKLPFAVLALTAVNLLIGYSTGMRREPPRS